MGLNGRRFLSTRVARRLLTLFLICTIVPLGVSSILAYRHVTRELVRQTDAQLRNAARAAGMSVLERLVAAETELGRVQVDPTGAPDEASLATALRLFQGLALGPAGGSPEWSHGAVPMPLPALGPVGLQRIEMGGTHLVALPDESAHLLVRGTDGGRALLWGTLQTDSLWVTARVYAGQEEGKSLCVLTSTGRALTCPGITTDTVQARAAAFDLSENPESGDHNGLRIASAPVHMQMQFGSDSWTVLVAEPSEEAFVPLRGFTRIFVPTVLLLLWSILLLVNVRIRHTIGPLERLREGTLRVSGGDFGTVVDVRTDDEFRDLADSFNRMSGQLGRQFRTLQAVHELDRLALRTPPLNELIDSLLHPLRVAVPRADFRVLLLFDGDALRLTDQQGEWHRKHLSVPPGLADELAGSASHFSFDGDSSSALRAALGGHVDDDGRVEVFPMFAQGTAIGALAARPRSERSLDPDELHQVRQLADQMALGLWSVQRQHQLSALKEGALQALALTIDASSRWTAGHSDRVTELSVGIAKQMDLPEEQLVLLRESALLHDIGKIGVPGHILDKPGALDPEEFEMVKSHTTLGERILSPIDAFRPMLPVVRHHHERYDGKGYPDGLKGEEIPFLARIVAVADTFDALVSDRPYRKGMPLEKACRVIEEEAGRQFDPAAVGAFMRLYATDLRTMIATQREKEAPEYSLAHV